MQAKLSAIETSYQGYRFRSRLEARWAVFFDALGLQWEYEPEGFELGDGRRYLPDFLLPNFCTEEGLFVEVKPRGGDFGKALDFARLSGRWLLCAEGIPDFRPYSTALTKPHTSSSEWIRCWASFVDEHLPGRLCSGEVGRPSVWKDPKVTRAIRAAKQARFEFGAGQ
jgi:hypothetical protein